MLIDKIRNREGDILLYGITPPKKGTEPEKVTEIANRQIERLESLNVDGLILYDIQDEKSRTPEERPFPFIETLDAFDYSQEHLAALDLPKIVYRAVGKYDREELSHFLASASPTKNMTVFVGASSSSQTIPLTLNEAYKLNAEVGSDVMLSGVTIPERHENKGDEHLRVFNKIAQGCRFFVSQGVYDVNAS